MEVFYDVTSKTAIIVYVDMQCTVSFCHADKNLVSVKCHFPGAQKPPRIFSLTSLYFLSRFFFFFDYAKGFISLNIVIF